MTKLQITSVFLLIAVSCVCGQAPKKSDASDAVEIVKAAWQKRQEKIKSLRIEWTETHQIPKGVAVHGYRIAVRVSVSNIGVG